jgi:hypothetical protein
MALHKLELMDAASYPGGHESKFHMENKEETTNHDSDRPKRAAAACHSLVTANRENFEVIRTEIISSAKNFILQRLCVEQERIITSMKGVLNAKTCEEMITAGSPLVEDLFPGELTNFANSVCEAWEWINELPHLPPEADRGCSLSTRLRQMLPITHGVLQKTLAAIMSLAPHSMQVRLMRTLFIFAAKSQK